MDIVEWKITELIEILFNTRNDRGAISWVLVLETDKAGRIFHPFC